MVDKRKERWYLTQLRACLQDFPAGRQEDGESPDFIIRDDFNTVGIEVTVFHLPPTTGKRPHQEVQTLKERIVAIGSKLHADAGGPGLYVSVFFNDPAKLSKRNAATMGQVLSTVVLSARVPTSIEEGAFRVPWAELPAGVGDITIHASVDGHDRLWSADAGGWVAPVQPDHLQAVIDAKGSMLPEARKKCGRVWLVVVNDRFGRASPAELSESSSQSRYHHGFDRLFWLEAHGPVAIELGKPANTPLQPTNDGQLL